MTKEVRMTALLLICVTLAPSSAFGAGGVPRSNGDEARRLPPRPAESAWLLVAARGAFQAGEPLIAACLCRAARLLAEPGGSVFEKALLAEAIIYEDLGCTPLAEQLCWRVLREGRWLSRRRVTALELLFGISAGRLKWSLERREYLLDFPLRQADALLNDLILRDAERVLRRLITVDYDGILTEKASFTLGLIATQREDHQAADLALGDFIRRWPNSQHAPKALRIRLFAKLELASGERDARRHANEAARLLAEAERASKGDWPPERDYLQRCRRRLHERQAELDFALGDSARRAGYPLAAFAAYAHVRFAYPTTEAAANVRDRLRSLAEKIPEYGPLTELLWWIERGLSPTEAAPKTE
jgi:outer membrane protein assembly factor BamD (BamD/ComL family)